MRGRDHVGTHRICAIALGGAVLLAALPGASVMGASEPADLPRCTADRSGTPDGGIASPWETILDEGGAVSGHRLTLRHQGNEHELWASRRGFAVAVGESRLLIGERDDGHTQLDMVDISRACRLWSRSVEHMLYPEQERVSGPVRLRSHARDSRGYQGTHILDPESGSTDAVIDEPCLEGCHPTDGAISLAALQAPTLLKPTPSFSAGGWSKDKKLSFRWKAGSVPPSWARSPLKNGALDATSSAHARSPRFVYSTSGANAVAYGALAGFCGAAAIACAGRSMPAYWGVWIRPHGTDFSWGTLRWCQKNAAASGCFDVRRVMVHELGHIAGLNHPSSAGYRLASADSVMQAVTPMRPQAGSSRHAFGRCDVATLQELYDTPDNKTSISTCNDVATQVTLSTSDGTIARGSSVKLVATLRVADHDGYRQLAANPLNGRSVKLKYRRAGSDDAWKTVWMRSTYRQGRYDATLTPATSSEFKAVFSKPGDEGLRYSRSEVRKVKVHG